MNQGLYLKITKWRDETARRENVEPYRVISSSAVQGIAESAPETDTELLEVKGIAEKKLAKYGAEILKMVREETGTSEDESLFGASDSQDFFDENEADENWEKTQPSKNEGDEKIFTVGDFLELLNVGLRSSRGKVRGEISSLDIRDRYLFFGLKDAQDGALMNCMMWKNEYELSGVALEEGMEVSVNGYPEIYKPYGKFTFRAQTVELYGEGALKQAYEKLKKELSEEGVFDEARKKKLPEYPERIGVITSKTGAVIHDFLNNLGRFGYHISMYDSRVEGQLAVRDLYAGLQYFKKENNIDVLVVMRGGGSLESLQAFNNEKLVREIADLPFPVIAGIGHDKDVPLFSLAADKLVSTPTAVANLLDKNWSEARSKVMLSEERIFGKYREVLQQKRYVLTNSTNHIQNGIRVILEKVRRTQQVFENSSGVLAYAISALKKKLEEQKNFLVRAYENELEKKRHRVKELESTLRTNSPKRQLKLGYSIARAGGKIVRSVDDLKKDDELEVLVADGKIKSDIKEINKNNHERGEQNESQ